MIVIKDTATGVIYPSENCTWVEVPVEGGYEIASVTTYITGTAVNIAAADLGYLGKTGRFVKISK